jgi:uncharacterized membrane protein YhaH (DUF805 family)
MPKSDEEMKKPGKMYWLINGVLLAILSVIFLVDVIAWHRYGGSLIFFLLTALIAAICYVQYKSVGEKKKK